MSDSNGLIQSNYYSFSVKNTGDSEAKYNLYLLDDADTISTYEGTLLDDKYLRVGLTKNEEELGPLNLDTQKRLIDTGVIDAGSTNNYKLRLWLNFEGLTDTEKDVLDGQSKFLKLKLTGEQNFSNTLADTIIKRDLKTNKNEASGLFSTNDTNSGKTSYYYKGNVTNNYVKLKEKTGDALYRIVRINEDESIRLIRQEGIDNNVTYAFNPDASTYEKMYYSNSNVDGGIMKKINDWYNENIKKTNINDYVVESTFCEEAKLTYAYDNFISTANGNAIMEVSNPNYTPTLKCKTDGNGKGLLNLKTGLLSLDEALLAGVTLYYSGITASEFNKNVYLFTNNVFRLISPAGYATTASKANAWLIDSPKLWVGNTYVSTPLITRPIINISSDVNIQGIGTIDNPFLLKF